MHAFDEERLQRLCGSHELPERLLQVYAVAEKIWHRISSGPLPDETLMGLVIQSQSYLIAEPKTCIWDNVPAYTDVIVSHRNETPFEAEFVRRKFGADGRAIGQVEIRLFGDDSTIRAEPEEFVKLVDQKTDRSWPQHLQGLQRGDLVGWQPADGDFQEVRFHGVEPGGQVHLKTGATNKKNTYVSADEVTILEPVEAG
jgi:hypothetical protein